MELLFQVVFRELAIPAMNKWTTLAPVIGQIAVMMCSWGLLQAVALHLTAGRAVCGAVR